MDGAPQGQSWRRKKNEVLSSLTHPPTQTNKGTVYQVRVQTTEECRPSTHPPTDIQLVLDTLKEVNARGTSYPPTHPPNPTQSNPTQPTPPIHRTHPPTHSSTQNQDSRAQRKEEEGEEEEAGRTATKWIGPRR